jgi:hypothetical protein
LQGAVQAVGTFNQLQNSGLDFARQLELEEETGDEDNNLNRINARLPDCRESNRSVNKWHRQDSQLSHVVSYIITIAASVKPFLVQCF